MVLIRTRLSRNFFRKWAIFIIVSGVTVAALVLALNFTSGTSQTLFVERIRIGSQEREASAAQSRALNRLMALNEQAQNTQDNDTINGQRLNEMAYIIAHQPYVDGLRAAEGQAREASDRYDQSILLSGVIALAGGAALGTVFAYRLEYRDVAFRTPRQVEQALEAQVLASLPALRGVEDKRIHLATDFAEPYRALAARLFPADEAPGKRLLVTSPEPTEGKSLTAANLALAVAEAGSRVLLIDANLRAPTLHRLFKLTNRDGLANLLYQYNEGMDSQIEHFIESYVRPTDVASLAILTSGPLPANPSDLLGLAKMPALLGALAVHYDLLIVDAAALLDTPDALPLIAACDRVLLVIDSRRTRRRAALQAKQLIRGAGGRLAGAAFNRAVKL